MSLQDELLSIDAEIVKLTGERFHAYTSVPGDGQTRVVFADGAVMRGYNAAVAYAGRMLAYVRINGSVGGWKYAIERGDA